MGVCRQGVDALPPDTPPLLALVMMVKNEADFINQTLASVKPHIDSWTIVDTGRRRIHGMTDALSLWQNVHAVLSHTSREAVACHL